LSGAGGTESGTLIFGGGSSEPGIVTESFGFGGASGIGKSTSGGDIGFVMSVGIDTGFFGSLPGNSIVGGVDGFFGSLPGRSITGGASGFFGSLPGNSMVGGVDGFFGSLPGRSITGGASGFFGSLPGNSMVGGLDGFFGSLPGRSITGGASGFFGSLPGNSMVGGLDGFFGSLPGRSITGGESGFLESVGGVSNRVGVMSGGVSAIGIDERGFSPGGGVNGTGARPDGIGSVFGASVGAAGMDGDFIDSADTTVLSSLSVMGGLLPKSVYFTMKTPATRLRKEHTTIKPTLVSRDMRSISRLFLPVHGQASCHRRTATRSFALRDLGFA
jgi:hypothetical protein